MDKTWLKQSSDHYSTFSKNMLPPVAAQSQETPKRQNRILPPDNQWYQSNTHFKSFLLTVKWHQQLSGGRKKSLAQHKSFLAATIWLGIIKVYEELVGRSKSILQKFTSTFIHLQMSFFFLRRHQSLFSQKVIWMLKSSANCHFFLFDLVMNWTEIHHD